MKVAVMNFSGNVGKSTVAKHLLLPRIENAEFLTVETINADEGDGEAMRGKDFGELQERLMLMDAAVIDVGSSNVEDFVKLMGRYSGSHEDVDLFVVPAVKESKQIKDTISTIESLAGMGVAAQRIRVVFNKLEADDSVEDLFAPLFAYQRKMKSCVLNRSAVIEFSELYQRLRDRNVTIADLLADTTDYKAKLRETTSTEEKANLAARISMRRLATSAQTNLNQVFAAITK